MIGASIPRQLRADGPERRVEPDVRGDRKVGDIIGADGDKRIARHKSRAREEFPKKTAEEFPEEGLARLIQRQLEAGGNFVAEYVVVCVAMDEARSDLISIFIQEELSSHGESPAAIVCK